MRERHVSRFHTKNTDIKESRRQRFDYSIGLRAKRPFICAMWDFLKGIQTSENQKGIVWYSDNKSIVRRSSHNFEQVNMFRTIKTQHKSKSLITLRRWSTKVITLQQDSICTSKDVQHTSHRITRIPVESQEREKVTIRLINCDKNQNNR